MSEPIIMNAPRNTTAIVMPIGQLFEHTDWQLLADQLDTLTGFLVSKQNGTVVEIGDEEADHIDGLLNWINYIRETAEVTDHPVVWNENK